MDDQRRAFVALFHAHFVDVLAYLRRRSGDPGVAEDVAAEVFRLAWVKQDPRNPLSRAWLYKVASDRLVDHYRAVGRLRQLETSLAHSLASQDDPSDIDERLALNAAILSLTAREQEVLRLTYWEDLPAAEVAQVLGMSASAVWTLLSRARATLGRVLDDSETESRTR